MHARGRNVRGTVLVMPMACVLAGLLVGSCTDKAKEPAQEASSTDLSSPDGLPVSGEPAALVPVADRGNVLGHVVFPNASRLISEVQAQLTPSQYAPMVTESVLRSLAAAQLGSRSNIPQKIDLAQPVGCAILDPKQYETPIVCAFAYQGGAAAFTSDLGSEGQQADPAPHLAHYQLDGRDAYVDALGDRVVISGSPQTFEASRSYLEKHIFVRAAQTARDFEIVVFAAEAMKRYQAEVSSLVAEVSKTIPSDKHEPVNAIAKLLSDYNARSTKDLVSKLGELDQVDLSFSIEPTMVVAQALMAPAAGSSLQKLGQALASVPSDRAHVTTLPASSWLVASSLSHPDAWQLPEAKQLRSDLARLYAESTNKDASVVARTVETFVQEMDTLYANQIAFSVMQDASVPFAGAVLWSMEPNQSGRSAWTKWARAFTPKDVLGAQGMRWVTWSFQQDAAQEHGIGIDRWIVEAGPKTREALEKELGKPKLAMLEDQLGGFRLVIDRAEHGGTAVFTFAAGKPGTVMQNTLAARNGQGSLVGSSALERVWSVHPNASGIVAIDGQKCIEWLRTVLPERERGRLPDLGNELGDISFGAVNTSDGMQRWQLVVTQSLVDQLRKLANQAD